MPLPGPPGTLQGTETLDQPPPSPALAQGMNPGSPSMTDLMGQTANPQVPADQMPQDVLTGMMTAATKIAQDLDSFAQMTPNLASDWAAVRAALAAAMSKLLMAGSNPTSPTAPGPGFPGGGLDRGGMALASGGLG